MPLARLYVQGDLSYVHDLTATPASDLLPAVQDAENDYWTANATVGFAPRRQDRSRGPVPLLPRGDKYVDNSDFGRARRGCRDHGVGAGLVRRLSARVRWSLKYGFFTSHEQLSGGNRDYTSHVVYSTLQYRF